MWPILVYQIGQFQPWVKFYAEIFYGIGSWLGKWESTKAWNQFQQTSEASNGSMVRRSRSYKNNLRIKFDSSMEFGQSISHVINLSFSDWSIQAYSQNLSWNLFRIGSRLMVHRKSRVLNLRLVIAWLNCNCDCSNNH